jgi:hypothetical protein
MNVKVLSKPVLSGSNEEVYFEASGDCTWVLFEDEETDWAGVFGRGLRNENSVASFNSGKYAFVVAGGQGYVIDVASRKLLYRTESDDLTGVLGAPSADLCIATLCPNRIHAYSSNGLVWASSRLGRGGLMLDSWDDKCVQGKVSDFDGWYLFTLNLAPFEFCRGNKIDDESSIFSA